VSARTTVAGILLRRRILHNLKVIILCDLVVWKLEGGRIDSTRITAKLRNRITVRSIRILQNLDKVIVDLTITSKVPNIWTRHKDLISTAEVLIQRMHRLMADRTSNVCKMMMVRSTTSLTRIARRDGASLVD
jgi:hypothetical protein